MSNLVDWGLAERIATRLARRNEPFADSYHYASLAARLRRAHRRRPRSSSPTCTGLRSLRRSGASAGHRPRRMGAGEHRLVPAPAAAGHRQARGAAARGRPAPPFASKVAGAEVGMMLGWMSARVLGQYDLLVIEDEQPRRPGPRLLRRPERARAREALRVPAARVPAVAGAARGHPPGPVHRRAVDARALPRRSSSRRSGRSTPTRSASSTP